MTAVAKPEAAEVAFLSSKLKELQGQLDALKLKAAPGVKKVVGVSAKTAAWNEFSDMWNAITEASSPVIVGFVKDCLDQLDAIVNDPSGKFKDLPTTKQYIVYLKFNSSLALSLWPDNVAQFAIMTPKEEIDKMLHDEGLLRLQVLARVSSDPKISSIVEAFREKYPNWPKLIKSFVHRECPGMSGTRKRKLMENDKLGLQWKNMIEKKSKSPVEASELRYKFTFDKGLQNLHTATILPERTKKKFKPRKQSEGNDSLNLGQTQNGASPKKTKIKGPSMQNDSDEHMSINEGTVPNTTPNKKKIKLRKQSESTGSSTPQNDNMNLDRNQNSVSSKKKKKSKGPLNVLNATLSVLNDSNEETVPNTTPNKKSIKLDKQSESTGASKQNDSVNLDPSQNVVRPKKNQKKKSIGPPAPQVK